MPPPRQLIILLVSSAEGPPKAHGGGWAGGGRDECAEGCVVDSIRRSISRRPTTPFLLACSRGIGNFQPSTSIINTQARTDAWRAPGAPAAAAAQAKEGRPPLPLPAFKRTRDDASISDLARDRIGRPINRSLIAIAHVCTEEPYGGRGENMRRRPRSQIARPLGLDRLVGAGRAPRWASVPVDGMMSRAGRPSINNHASLPRSGRDQFGRVWARTWFVGMRARRPPTCVVERGAAPGVGRAVDAAIAAVMPSIDG